MECVALISTPWPLYNRPSIQIGTLKAYLTHNIPDLDVKAYPIYLKIAEHVGYPLYHAVSQRTWLAETVYSVLLYPERLERIEKIFKKETDSKPFLRNVTLEALATRVRDVSEAFVQEVKWKSIGLAGFSICLCQLTSALWFIRRIKQICPGLPIVVGGSAFSGRSAQSLLRVFPEIEFVIIGEGELPLAQLVRYLRNRQSDEAILANPAMISRKSLEAGRSMAFCQTETLDGIPIPDYDDYFHLLGTFEPKKSFFPILPVEMSRGCWWKSKRKSFSGCAFCNLNLQWEGYRSKAPSRIVSEIDQLTTAHKLLSVSVMDNAPPLNTSEAIFSQLSGINKDVNLFCELRASTTLNLLKSMRTAGVNEVQIGIESLSSRLLDKMNKGTTAIQNLEIMKNCEALGIENNSNLIIHFPGSDDRDIEETLKNMEFALPFRPLKQVSFWLGLESPVWQDPHAFGIRSVFNHPNYAALFPRDIFRAIPFMIQDYRGDKGYQRKLWQPVRKKLKAWKTAYEKARISSSRGPILSFQDGGNFLIIRQKRVENDAATHRLVGVSREIYLFCQTHRSIRSILHRFPALTEDQLVPFLSLMVGKKLMFSENNRYLSLAVPVKGKEI